MERRYTYFKNLLNESMDSINQLKLKSELINDFKETISNKTTSLQEQINKLRAIYFLDTNESIIDKLNHIKQLQISLDEKDEIIKSLENEISSLNYKGSSEKKANSNYDDDLPF